MARADGVRLSVLIGLIPSVAFSVWLLLTSIQNVAGAPGPANSIWLAGQGEDTLAFHLDRLHQLATPLVDLNRPALASSSGSPSTFDISCWEQGAATRLQGWLENHLPDSASIAVTGDPRRATYIRLISGFDLESLSAGE